MTLAQRLIRSVVMKQELYRSKEDKHPSCPNPWCHPTDPPKDTALVDSKTIDLANWGRWWPARPRSEFTYAVDDEGWLFWWRRTLGVCGWIGPERWRRRNSDE